MAKVVVRVQPAASKSRLLGRWGEGWKLAVRERPVDGKATEAARRLLADILDLRPVEVRLVQGVASRTKAFETTLSSEETDMRLAAACAKMENK